MGRPHDLGNISKYLGKPTGLEDYIGWLGSNFDPSISWKDLEWIREFWDGPMVIKGILDPEDAKDAVRFGADGIVVSNHGGRQLDGVMSSARALPAIADAVKGDLAILADSGIRNGLDVVRMLYGIYRAMGYEKRDPVRPQFTDHCFTGDYPTNLTDVRGETPRQQLSLLAETG